jgi:transcription elongation factor Elf1
MTKPFSCPFCGSDPVTYFETIGTIKGHPAIKAFIKCEECEITLSSMAKWDTPTGITSFESMNRCMESVIAKWNARSTQGKQFTADEVRSALIEAGQHDTGKFKLGDVIRYDPDEVREILMKQKGE